MTSPWDSLSSLLEAKSAAAYKDDMLRYITRRKGEWAAEELKGILQSKRGMDLVKAIQYKYMDPNMDDMVDGMVRSAGIDPETGRPPRDLNPASGDDDGDPFRGPEMASSKDKGSGNAEPIPARPDRAGTKANLPATDRQPVKPGEKPTQAVGNAGQLQPRPQPSVTGQGAQFKGKPMQVQAAKGNNSATELSDLRAKLKKIQTDPSGWIRGKDGGPPAAKPETARTMTKLQARIKDLSKEGDSGLVASQKKVDYITKNYGDEMGDKMAKELGVPTTAQRTVRDEEGKERIAIWSPDKIAKLGRNDAENKSSQELDAERDKNKASPTGRTDKIKAAQAARGDAKPDLNRTRTVNVGGAKIQAPDKDPDQATKPNFKGSFVGQKWSPAGMSKRVAVARPDMSTGNFQHASRETNPAGQGAAYVWNGKDWDKASAHIAKAAVDKVAEKPEDTE